jgi:hypothetical protein
MFVFFVFRKNAVIKNCSSSEYLLEYKISWSYIEWCKFSIHLRSANVRHFGIVAATALKIMASRSRKRGSSWNVWDVPHDTLFMTAASSRDSIATCCVNHKPPLGRIHQVQEADCVSSNVWSTAVTQHRNTGTATYTYRSTAKLPHTQHTRITFVLINSLLHRARRQNWAQRDLNKRKRKNIWYSYAHIHHSLFESLDGITHK